jgi:hypothetical protein
MNNTIRETEPNNQKFKMLLGAALLVVAMYFVMLVNFLH